MNFKKRLTAALPEIFLFALQLLLLYATRVAQNAVDVDDAFIHFRNSMNWAEGHGLVFNPGERVMGSTSPIFALILGVLHKVTGAEIPLVARNLNFFLDVGIALLALRWLRRAEIPRLTSHAVLAVLSLEPFRMIYSIGGMEMSLFILASMFVVELFLTRQWLAGGLILGGLGWIRPEGVIVGVTVIVALLYEKRR